MEMMTPGRLGESTGRCCVRGEGMWIVMSVGITTAGAVNHGTNWSQVPSLAPLAEMRGSADCMVAADSAARPTLNRLGG